MGLLDDAIREHLELKRRHGADPSEVERQEQEALGPARRGAAPPPEAEADAGAVSVGTLDEADEFDEPDAALEEPYDEADDDDEPEPSVPAGEPEAPVAPPAPADDEDDDEPEADARGRGDDPAPPARDAAGEDVLEETPDFLQETPEHDRLWFEQKPPRDFEF
jgi:hypothetical protein